jgi:hypothetical protein
MNASELKVYLCEMQKSDAIDPKSLADYAAMVGSLNRLILDASEKKLDPNDEPADFQKLLVEATR